MRNKDIHSYYDRLAARIQDPLETRNKAKDFSAFDIAFMKARSGADKMLLDLGSGTGLLLNQLGGCFKHIVAVERYPQFSRFIQPRDDLEIVNEDVLNFVDERHFDVISAFGLMNFFNRNEASAIYARCFSMLVPDGVLIVKNQFGLAAEVTVEGWSDELGEPYFSNYRHINAEEDLLRSIGFQKIERFDIYPADFNRFDNTHFFALVCQK